MRVHAIEHPHRDGRYLINEQRPCNKPVGICDLVHRHVFTDDELANHEHHLSTLVLEELL